MKATASKILLRLALVVTLVVFFYLKNKDDQQNKVKLPTTKFVVSGTIGLTFRFQAVEVQGGRWDLSTTLSESSMPVLTAKNRDFASCRIERVKGSGAITLKIFHDTNLVFATELPPDRRVVELKRNGWTDKTF